MIYTYFHEYIKGQGHVEAFKKFIMICSLKCFFNTNELLQCTWHKTIKTFDEMPVIVDLDKFVEAYKNEMFINAPHEQRKQKILAFKKQQQEKNQKRKK